jgi:sterol desaturase/sphingolipid hydroxylase (fatty acid hydroxylase superfamily)
MSSSQSRIPVHLKPRPGEPVMFQSAVLERLSKVPPVLVLLLYSPLIIAFLLYSIFESELGLPRIVVYFLLGLLFWTLFEWLFHRWVFHFSPRTNLGFRIQFLMHGVHHQYPRDEERLVMPVAVSGVVAVVMWFLFESLLGVRALAFYPGFVFGYLCYDMIHFSIHHFKVPLNPILRPIWLHHRDHHFKDPGRGFGVSTPLWDFVFEFLRAPGRRT